MYVSYADVFQFALVLFVPAPFGKQKEIAAPSQRFAAISMPK